MSIQKTKSSGYHPHPNGGGMVADSAKVSHYVYVAPQARVENDAVVEGRHVRILKKGRVLGKAKVKDHATIYGTVQDEAYVGGHVVIEPFAIVGAKAVVRGDAIIKEQGRVIGNSIIEDKAIILGHGLIAGNSVIKDHAQVRDRGKVYDSTVKDFAVVSGNATIFSNNIIKDDAIISDNAKITGKNITVEKHSFIGGNIVLKKNNMNYTNKHITKNEDLMKEESDIPAGKYNLNDLGLLGRFNKNVP